jgi:tyrosyl-tRNA synthetase
VAIVHGPASAAAAEEATELLFGSGDPLSASATAFEFLADEVPTAAVPVTGRPLADVLAEAGVVKSKSEARRALEQGGVSVNGAKVGPDAEVGDGDLLHGRWVLLRRGKRSYHLIEVARP